MQINLKSYLNPEKRCQNKQQLKTIKIHPTSYQHLLYSLITDWG